MIYDSGQKIVDSSFTIFEAIERLHLFGRSNKRLSDNMIFFNLDNSDRDYYDFLMNVTKKHYYGLSAMVQLGFLFDQGPVQLRYISDQADIPHSFLEQLILDLKKVGLVKSTRGARGGYQLSKSPQNISVQSILSAIDPLVFEVDASSSLSFFWNQLNTRLNDFLDLPLQAIMDDILKKERVLTYSI